MPSARTPDPSSAPSAPRSAPGAVPRSAPGAAPDSATGSAPRSAPGAATLPPSAPRTPPAAASLPPATLRPAALPPAPAAPPATPPAASPAASFGGLRLIEVPGDWPPYDCEVHRGGCPAGSQVPVASSCAGQDPGAPRSAEPPGPSLTFSASQPAEGPADPAVAWSRQFAQVIVEILAGARSPRQLTPWTTERVRERISLLTQTLAPGQKPRIRRIMTSRPAARVVEMTVVLSFGPRSRALALRLEHLPGRLPAPGLPARPARWLCTEIEVG